MNGFLEKGFKGRLSLPSKKKFLDVEFSEEEFEVTGKLTIEGLSIKEAKQLLQQISEGALEKDNG